MAVAPGKSVLIAVKPKLWQSQVDPSHPGAAALSANREEEFGPFYRMHVLGLDSLFLEFSLCV